LKKITITITVFTAHAQKRLFRSFRSKIWPRHSLRRPRFPIRRVYFHYPMTFTAYIWCFVHNFALTLWRWPSAFWRIKSLTHPTHTDLPNFSTLWLPFLSYVWPNLITLPSPGTVTAHAPYHVTYHRGQKWSTSWPPIFLFTLSLSAVWR